MFYQFYPAVNSADGVRFIFHSRLPFLIWFALNRGVGGLRVQCAHRVTPLSALIVILHRDYRIVKPMGDHEVLILLIVMTFFCLTFRFSDSENKIYKWSMLVSSVYLSTHCRIINFFIITNVKALKSSIYFWLLP